MCAVWFGSEDVDVTAVRVEVIYGMALEAEDESSAGLLANVAANLKTEIRLDSRTPEEISS